MGHTDSGIDKSNLATVKRWATSLPSRPALKRLYDDDGVGGYEHREALLLEIAGCMRITDRIIRRAEGTMKLSWEMRRIALVRLGICLNVHFEIGLRETRGRGRAAIAWVFPRHAAHPDPHLSNYWITCGVLFESAQESRGLRRSIAHG